MSEITLEKEETKLEKFLVKEGRRDFVDEMRAAAESGDRTKLDEKILGLAKHREEIRNTMARDEELKSAKARARDLGASYREQLKMNDKLARFIALLTKDDDKE